MKLTTQTNNGEVIMEITETKSNTSDKSDLIVDLHLGGSDWEWDSFGVDTLTKETTIHLTKGYNQGENKMNRELGVYIIVAIIIILCIQLYKTFFD